MSKNKVIAVTGATGAQGGGLARAILANPASGFSVRAITRHPEGDKARALAALGAEIVAADLDDAGSVQRAFAGAYGAFCVTSFWEHLAPEREQQQARYMAAAARHEGLRHVVWSTLEDVRRWVPLGSASMPTLGGKWKVPHFDAKGEMDAVFTNLGVPTTFVRASFYWENFIHLGTGPQRAKDGSLVLTFPMADRKLAGIAASDIGKCVFGVFNLGDVAIGKTIGLAGEHLTGQQLAAAMSRKLGVPIHYAPMPVEVFRQLGFPGAKDLGNMFQFYSDFEKLVCQNRSIESSRKLNPDLLDFADWLELQGEKIPVPQARNQEAQECAG